jgi:3-phosphoshikimate 1-carboxyvinyltransferase
MPADDAAAASAVRIEPAREVGGHIAVPGDKSISHRAVLLGAIADGETRVTGFGRGADTEATVAAVRALGVEVEEPDVDELVVRGRGLRGLRAPAGPVDCGNAGTLMRLLAGILAGQEGTFTLTGDASLRSRPMERVAEPLRRMGAGVETADGRAPVTITGAPRLRGLYYRLPVASAQVKSAVLLAGLYADGRTTVVEPLPSRDHTELMLGTAGVRVARRPASVSVDPPERLVLPDVEVPGDFSSAAPFVVAAALVAGSQLTVHGLGLNPRRAGLLDVLERMGARISIYNRRRAGAEPVGDVEIHAAPLVATTIEAREVPGLVDELPLLALAAGLARGETVVRGAEELRVKESDRIEAVTTALRAIGVRIVATPDGFRVRGVPTRPRGGTVDSAGDHRIAMLGAVAGLVSSQGVAVEGGEAVAVSFPGFFELLAGIARRSNAG